jgi:hypothetical protein
LKCVAALIAILVLVGPAGAGELRRVSAPSFRVPRDFDTTIKAAESVAIGDLNGDAKQDVVASHGTDFPPDLSSLRAVSVFLNRGDGRLRPPHVFQTGKEGDELGAWSVALGDLDGDGKADLVTANPGGKSVSVLVNTGTGAFDPAVNYSLGREPSDVAIADFDGDGKPDIATANPNTVSVLLNKGDGTFRDRLEYPAGRSTWAFAVGDLNGDGTPDLATANNSVRTISVLINRGDGSFPTKVDYRTPPGPRTIAIGDLDGDRRLDLVTANGSTDPTGRDEWIESVSVFLNKGNGALRPRHDYKPRLDDERVAYNAVRIGDVNEDRKPDIVTANGKDEAISVLVNKGKGTFSGRFDYGYGSDEDVGFGAEAVALGDLNNDRRLDVVVPRWLSVAVFINSPGVCTVREVRWIKLAAARGILATSHCLVGNIRRRYGSARGTVISQRPPVGTVLPKGGRVNLVVSIGRRPS